MKLARGWRSSVAMKQKNDIIQADLGGTGAVFSLDNRDEVVVERMVEQVVNCFGQLDILVNNARTIYVDSAQDQQQLIDIGRVVSGLPGLT
jgi:NAD(P)-dependent dehydrogenase (short-subunit alcohol dehydrogenase family)